MVTKIYVKFVSHPTGAHSISGFIYFEFDIRFCKNQGAMKNKMPLKLSTTIGKIQNSPNSKNI